nr:TIM barrel protein [Kineococcus siccus]
MRAVAAAGYAGSELGPTGYLGPPAATAEAFAAAGLRPAGVYVGLRLAAGAPQADDLAALTAACRTLRAAVDATSHLPGAAPPAPIVLADDGAPHLATAPRDPDDTTGGLDAADWRRAAATLAVAAAVVAEHGLPVSFHPHLATHVESRREVERLLETTDLGVTLDTGHLALAGADPVACLRAWGDRVDHVHVKDVDLSVAARARRDGPVPLRSWWARACVPLGAGDVDLAGLLAALADRGHPGWLVVEQDHEPTGAPELPALQAVQTANLAVLRRLAARAAPRPEGG